MNAASAGGDMVRVDMGIVSDIVCWKVITNDSERLSNGDHYEMPLPG
jgi:hypothetical protein